MATRSSYDTLKEFGGKRYTGMRVGRSHKWKYDAGEWKERKVTPDRWEFSYAVKKRRAGRAPEGSGAPLGTAYYWFIVADQVVTKLDANTYMTEMVGHKLKVAHRRADKTSWSASARAQRRVLVKLLRELADDLESRPLEPEAMPAANGTRAARPHADGHARASGGARHRPRHRPNAASHRPQHARSRTPSRSASRH